VIQDGQLTVAAVREETIAGALVAQGRVAFDDLRVAHIYSPVTGRITRILVEPGQRVKKGAALCTIESPDLGQAVADVAKARAALSQSTSDRKRQQELAPVGGTSQRDLESAENAFRQDSAELERAIAKAQLLGAGATQTYTLRAPIAGEVIGRAANPGLEVQGQYSGGQPVELFTIGELDRVWAIVDVYQDDLSRVRKGAPIEVHAVAFPGRAFTGTIEWISGALDANTHTAKVRCSIDNPNLLLRAEMSATALISTSAERVLAIPRSAIVRLGDQPIVFVESGQAPNGARLFERRPVVLDETADGAIVPVLHGLKPGEPIVTAGSAVLLGR
jgi:cobalt-zinc-cadmium efflux system membrane fusion protein